MPKAVIRSELAVEAKAIWAAIRKFDSIDDWNPLAKAVHIEGEGIGSVRTLEIQGAGKFVERLDDFDEDERAYTYTIIESPLCLTSCTVELRVKDNGNRTSTVQWSSNFEVLGDRELLPVRTFQQMYQDALNNIGSIVAVDNRGGN